MVMSEFDGAEGKQRGGFRLKGARADATQSLGRRERKFCIRYKIVNLKDYKNKHAAV